MGQGPFGKRPTVQDAGASRRRSTRVDHVAPVILTGRDASGQVFHEETETSTVNFHGCKLRTHHKVMVGMQVGIENPETGMAEKAICVWVGETPPDQIAHDIAIQLLNPKNMWGLENPPADWNAQTEARAGAQPPAPQRVSKVAKSPAPVASSAAASAVAAGMAASLDLQVGELEQRAAQLVESVLEKVRKQSQEVVGETLQEFERRLKELVAGAEARVRERAEKAYEEVESSLQTLRADLASQLTERTDQVVESAEEALRSKVAEMFSMLVSPTSPKQAERKK